ncbi:MAG TPA: cellulose synthase operon protein YhjQ/BcsQ [Acidobacteriaceae bacterium]|nr:cellulose synthase operon protein YhjQ/BcsQ [Acidobacteriaceae bacterium]
MEKANLLSAVPQRDSAENASAPIPPVSSKQGSGESPPSPGSGVASAAAAPQPLVPLSRPIAAEAALSPSFWEPAPSPAGNSHSASIAIYSLAGGVGKTTICANLGRILCSRGEHVLLMDASGSGLLPFYFGSSNFRPGFRIFADPQGQYPPVRVLGETDAITTAWLDETLDPAMRAVQRTIFDLGAASMAALPQILSRCGALLVPLRTDLNSILTVPRIEAMVSAMRAQGLTVPVPHYVFNAWNEQSSRDQQMRDLVSRQCGGRLLPIAIRDGHECEEAIAGRMTVADHSPASEIASDYSSLAAWISDLLPAQPRTVAAQRWVER